MFKAASGAVYRGVKAQSSSPLQSFGLRLLDAGSGAVKLTAQGAGSITPTFTRATTAWTKLSTGLWAAVGTGVARSSYLGANTAVGVYGGYLVEGLRQNLCLQSRDLSTTWTALNATLVKDQVGIDGVGNSASSMTATLANGSALQTITEAATASALSMFIKRITGNGTVTIQQGASTLEVSGSINNTTYTRVELDATVLNPIIGIVLGTNADKIAVDMVQFENGTFASSPIPTTTVAVTRNADVLRYPSAGNISGTQGSVYLEYSVNGFGPAGQQLTLSSNTGAAQFLTPRTSTILDSYDGSGNTTLATVTARSLGVVYKAAMSWNNGVDQGYENSVTAGAKTFVSPWNLGATIDVGHSNGVNELFGTIGNVRIYPTALSATQLQAMTT